MKDNPKATKSVAQIESQTAINQLLESASRGELVAIIGTGVSMSLTNGSIPALSWTGLISDGFTYGVKKGLIKPEQEKAWEPQLASNDIDDLLCAAEFLSRKLGAPQGDLYARWIQNVFSTVKPVNAKMKKALVALNKIGIPICTLNYDLLLEQVTGLNGINMNETTKVASWMRKGNPGILHLHGSSISPETCILGIRDYETTLGDDVRELIQRSLASFHRLLFIGCGDTFTDPNFSALIKWMRESMKTAKLEHYALVIDSDVAACHANAAWHGFIEPVGYGTVHNDLPMFLLKHFPTVNSESKVQKIDVNKSEVTSPDQTKIINDYLAFLLKDCGQMTIEGVRADMEIGQRKFDIERLFVPLEVLQCPPEIPDSDPNREEKLRKWIEKNEKPRPFGKVLEIHKRIALLALPGGGKTLLLKRLAVAYADRNRRQSSEDALPDLDVIPVLIRCREWREHIQCPIITILQKLPEISGDIRLSGIAEVLIPLFKKGRILLLVDGLDEIHNDAHRTTFVEHLETFLDEFKLTRLIVTSREAGFGLVAPCISRFCDRWRVAPLQENAITSLCDHWQSLMVGNSPQAKTEGQEVAQYLLRNDSLRRLAENPLLLTMLLVVKHGSGRLPPDRVSLYSRAVEVLLDTWNIKGHDSLNPKEAVPQLACVAFQMMKVGKQTATEKELLTLLEDARDKVPQIRRYAKDTPSDFLKRVELRSSLLVEAGHKVEAGQTVPFYQFRHLTFQEYLAAIAAVEGHYLEYNKNDTVLTPLEPYLITEEWKEVVPMAAVLARKQAEPLIAALVAESSRLREKVESGEKLDSEWQIGSNVPKLPSPLSRLVQCLIEEAEAAPETLTAALQLTAFFADGCNSGEDWSALSRGPYGSELLHQAWLLYFSSQQREDDKDILGTYSKLSTFQHPMTFWFSNEGITYLELLLYSSNQEEIALGIFSCAGLFINFDQITQQHSRKITQFSVKIEEHLLKRDPILQLASVHALTMIWNNYMDKGHKIIQTSTMVLDYLLGLRLHATNKDLVFWSKIALCMQSCLRRGLWKPSLNESESLKIQESFKGVINEIDRDKYWPILCDLMIAFHALTVFTDNTLAKHLIKLKESNKERYHNYLIDGILKQLNIKVKKNIKPRITKVH